MNSYDGVDEPFSANAEKQFHRSESVPNATRRLVEMLDHIEQRVELLRGHASAMEQEKEDLLMLLSTIKSNADLKNVGEGEREEIELTAQRLTDRTKTVEVKVATPRNEIQQKALDKVDELLDELLQSLNTCVDNSRTALQHYINACTSDCKGQADQKFQTAILDCTADDQKRTRKKLQNLMDALSHSKF